MTRFMFKSAIGLIVGTVVGMFLVSTILGQGQPWSDLIENSECDEETFLDCNWQYQCDDDSEGLPCDSCTAALSVSKCVGFVENQDCADTHYPSGPNSCGWIVTGTCKIDPTGTPFCDDTVTQNPCERIVCQNL